MRGADAMQESLFTVAKLEDFVPADHPLRPIRMLVNDALEAMSPRFNSNGGASLRESSTMAPARPQIAGGVEPRQRAWCRRRRHAVGGGDWHVGFGIAQVSESASGGPSSLQPHVAQSYIPWISFNCVTL